MIEPAFNDTTFDLTGYDGPPKMIYVRMGDLHLRMTICRCEWSDHDDMSILVCATDPKRVYLSNGNSVIETDGVMAYAETDENPSQLANHRPMRGDQVAEWIKRSRDFFAGSDDDRDLCYYRAVDGLLDDYRLHADVGAPLYRDVSEGPREP